MHPPALGADAPSRLPVSPPPPRCRELRRRDGSQGRSEILESGLLSFLQRKTVTKDVVHGSNTNGVASSARKNLGLLLCMRKLRGSALTCVLCGLARRHRWTELVRDAAATEWKRELS
eukprot:gnl/TRDRNA2_/TRDRNA2_175345_c1_seq3.p1 gnl/TRDRNA2_/TRDRNA2_175345_c1~~gnl/TRDRNA2_/TRDRNA2_175345_c1_seq3.p1  ORF type:complete len:118 (-),score=16.32 gnl/TRDRNA2_/TRDRNA2_175345_c1_seq3:7-360(-)